MRKENVSRLLLSIMTAFVMVIGVFGAAIYPSFTMDGGVEERSSVENSIAVDELEDRTGEIGEAPISANDQEQTITWTKGRDLGETVGMETTVFDEEENVPEREHKPAATDTPTETSTDHGTRAVSVEANGPYGEKTDPRFEGETIIFNADIVGGSNMDHKFRWEVTGDGEFDGPGPASNDHWGDWGETEFSHKFTDNHAGEVHVQAWDTVSTKLGPEGNMLDEMYYDYSYWLPVPRFYQNPSPNGRDGTWGLQFDVYKDCMVDQLGFFKTYAPNPIYNVRLWDMSTQQCIGVNLGLYPLPYYDWKWVPIKDPADPFGPDISVNLEAGKSYIVSAHIYYYDGRFPKNDNPGPTADGVMEPITSWFNSGGDSFPGIYERGGDIVLLDVHYLSFEPDAHKDTAGIFVDNVPPVVLDAHATITMGQEGAEVFFTASFQDPGLDDEWMYRWLFGDGTASNWKTVSKFAGGARILICTSYYDFDQTEIEAIMHDELGDFAVQVDIFDWGPVGENRAPTWDEVKDYDVIIVGENYISVPSIRDDLGDVLADFSDAGKGVVTSWVSDMDDSYYGTGGVMGRWRDEDYHVFEPGDLRFYSSSLGWFDGGDPIMQGVSSMSFYYEYYEPARTDATVVAQDNYGYDMIAHKVNPSGSGGRIVGFAFMPAATGAGGDYGRALANAVKWASQQPDPSPIQMPIELDPVGHVYSDDHPTTITPEDLFTATLEVKDDDHEAVIPIGGVATLLSEDFSSWMVPPPGWNKNPWTTNWRLYSGNLAGGTAPEAWFYWYPYVFGTYRLHSPPVDTTSWGAVDISFRQYVNHYGGSYDLQVETSADGVNWDVAWEMSPSTSIPAEVVTLSTNVNIGGPTTYFSWTFHGDPWNINYWNIDDLEVVAFESHEMSGLGTGECDITIENVFPGVIVPENFVDVVDEKITIDFAGFELTDPAIDQLTESYWYRWDFGDGTPIGPWINKGTCGKPSFNILLATTWSGIQGTVASILETELAEFSPTVDIFNWYEQGSPPDLSLMQQYDVVLVGTNYIPTSTLANQMGDRLFEFCQQGGNVVQMWSSFHTSARITGDWTANNYNVIERGSLHYGTESMGDVYDPDHPIMEGVTAMDAYYKHNSYDANDNAVRLADYSTGKVLAAYADTNAHPAGNGRIAGLAFFPSSGYIGGDAITMMVNAVKWAAGVTDLNSPILDAVSHDFGDNGIYDVVIQVIDDDMWWDLSGAQPVFTGPGNPEDWISFNHFPVEVLNVDPWITPGIRAEVALDLVIRTTGEPKNDCTMTLWDGTTMLGRVTVFHDGNYKMETLPAVLDMGNINNYFVTVEYTNADPSGANPTWVFEGRFPSGHTKELRKVFKEDGTVWTIGPEHLKQMIVGEEILFTAHGDDVGSDDLAFNWKYDDGKEDIHVFANADLSMAVGEDQAPQDVFNAHPDRDPAFIPGLNSIKSPELKPISVTDEVTHAFDEPGFFVVCLLLTDDDVGDGYPSFQFFMNGGGYDMEFVTIDLA